MVDINELKLIIQDLIKASKESNLKISDEKIFDNSCQFMRGALASKNKESNQIVKQEQRKLEPMTENQSRFIKKNEIELRTKGFDIDNIQNKSAAFKNINEFMKSKEAKNETRRKTNADY